MELIDVRDKLVITANHIDSKTEKGVDPEFLKVSIIKENGHPLRHDDRTLPFHPAGCQIPKSQVSLRRSNGTLTFYCTITALTKTIVPVSRKYNNYWTYVDLPVEQKPVSSTDSAAIDCSDGLSIQFEKLFNEMKFSDVRFNIEDRQFNAHKSILAAKSKVFAAMFEHPTKDKLTNQITIEDVEPEVFHELLRFIYTGRLSTTAMESMAVGLLIAADKYFLEELKVKCDNYLIREMSPDNCIELLLHEHLPGSAKSELKELATHFLSLNEGKGPELTD
jgi:speckle-type POZ protein